MKKTVTAIITTYNSEKTIRRTLESVLNQQGKGTLFELEVIVVDDCSTDNTVEIIKDFQVTLMSTGKNTGGPNVGRNMGLKAAQGDFICIVDHDDTWVEHKIISQLPYLEKAPIVTSGYIAIKVLENKQIEKVNKNHGEFVFYDKNRTFLTKLTKSLRGQNTYLGSIIYRKELKDIHFEESFGMVDFDWVLRLFYGQESIEVCKALYYRYVFDTNLSLNEGYRAKDFYFSLMAIEQYAQEFPKEVRHSYKMIHGSRARYYYLLGNMKLARFYFFHSVWNKKTFLYFITTFWGSKYVKKRFNVFG